MIQCICQRVITMIFVLNFLNMYFPFVIMSYTCCHALFFYLAIHLPKHGGQHIYKTSCARWTLVCPNRVPEVQVLTNEKPKANFDSGWMQFCWLNSLKKCDIFTFTVVPGVTRPIDVSTKWI